MQISKNYVKNNSTLQFQEPHFINGLSAIYNNYEGFIIDLWGVLHDGVNPYPKAIETLKNLKDDGKKIVLLSNAPRRSSVAKQTLDRLGFSEDMYDKLITSGEITFEYVRDALLGNDKNSSIHSRESGNPTLTRGFASSISQGERVRSYFYIGPDKDRDILNGLDLQEVSKAADANFAIVTGFENFGSLFEEKKAQVDEALKAGLTLLCANPDFKVVKQTGEEQICAGLIGEYYKSNGGKVIYFGKPYESAYKKCFEVMGFKFSCHSRESGNLDSGFRQNDKKILCIGDSIHTDILGATNSGCDSLFVAHGIHKNELVESEYMNLFKLKELCEKYNTCPTYLIKEFFW